MDGYSRRDLVRIARAEVSIYVVCDEIGVEYKSMAGDRAKLYCPFGNVAHLDGGQTRAFRIYEDSGTAYCFACSQFYDPVTLYAEYEDLSIEDAAEALLRIINWRPETFDVVWERATEVEEFDPSYLPEALHMYCRRLDPNWVVTQMREPYKTTLGRCVLASKAVKDKKQAEAWLSAAKIRMKQVFDVQG